MGPDDGMSGREERDGAVFGVAPVLADVRNRFDGGWSGGFEVVETLADHDDGPSFRLRRLSDGRVLPELFSAAEVMIRDE